MATVSLNGDFLASGEARGVALATPRARWCGRFDLAALVFTQRAPISNLWPTCTLLLDGE